MDQAKKRVVFNILKCYTGYFDVFSEIIQNALDAIETKLSIDNTFTPQIWIKIDIPNSLITIIDNGIGMDLEVFKLCLTPNVSFKENSLDLRGHKGVGATFLAYGFSFLQIQSKQNNQNIAANFRQGRQWTEDTSGSVSRPFFEQIKYDLPELKDESSGTSINILIGKHSTERPKDLSWIGAQTAEQWYDVLRIKTPLGGIYLTTPPKLKNNFPKINIKVISSNKSTTDFSSLRGEYYYPHEIKDLRVKQIEDIEQELNTIQGDPATKFSKLKSSFKKLDCIYDIWDKNQLIDENSPFYSALDEENKLLIEKHSVVLYACFLRSAKLWSEFNDNNLKLRKGAKIYHGGLQMASDYMVQGDLMIIPLTRTIGYQANSHVIVHFTNGNPDMGRKVFQPELKELAETLAVRSVNHMKKFLTHLRPDTGGPIIVPAKELYEWKKEQEEYRDQNPLTFNYKDNKICILSEPQQEQDVIALFHQLLGIKKVKGLKFFTTSQSNRYDSLFLLDYSDEDLLYDSEKVKLGVSRNIEIPYISEPKVLEYKFNFDSLVTDIQNEEKFVNQIDYVICWETGNLFKESFFLQSLLVDEEGSERFIYGSTHKAYSTGDHNNAAFEILILKDLINWIQDPDQEIARQKSFYN